MQASHDLAGVRISFDEANLVPCAGLLPAALLEHRLDLAGLVDERLSLDRYGANSGTKAMTVIGSMLAGADSIDDTDVLRAGALPVLFDQGRAPSTVGTWLRDFRWHNVRQLDAISRELLVRQWAAGRWPDRPGRADDDRRGLHYRAGVRPWQAGRRIRLHQG